MSRSIFMLAFGLCTLLSMITAEPDIVQYDEIALEATTVEEELTTETGQTSILYLTGFSIAKYETEGTETILKDSIAKALTKYCTDEPTSCDPSVSETNISYVVSADDVAIGDLVEISTTNSDISLFAEETDLQVSYSVMNNQGTVIKSEVTNQAVYNDNEAISSAVGTTVVVEDVPVTTLAPTTTSEPPIPVKDNSLEPWAIALITMSAVVVLGAIIYGIYYFCTKNSKTSGDYSYENETGIQRMSSIEKNKRESDYDKLFADRKSGKKEATVSTFQYDNMAYSTIEDAQKDSRQMNIYEEVPQEKRAESFTHL